MTIAESDSVKMKEQELIRGAGPDGDRSSETGIWFSTDSYVTIATHCFQHPNTAVCGILLGTTDTSPTSFSDMNPTSFSEMNPDAPPGSIHCYKVIPLLHGRLLNAPVLSFGAQVSSNLARSSGLSIVGAYFANGGSSGTNSGASLSSEASMIFSRLVEHLPTTSDQQAAAAAVLVNPRVLATILSDESERVEAVPAASHNASIIAKGITCVAGYVPNSRRCKFPVACAVPGTASVALRTAFLTGRHPRSRDCLDHLASISSEPVLQDHPRTIKKASQQSSVGSTVGTDADSRRGRRK